MKQQDDFIIRLVRGATVLAVLIAAASAPLLLVADGYRFIVSGYPAANESYAANSPGTEIATARQRGGSAAASVEARDITRAASEGIAMRSDEFRGLFIMVR